jgi:[Skp1-protein]-hydroxyproline N-acetylglucosaminyltransferase
MNSPNNSTSPTKRKKRLRRKPKGDLDTMPSSSSSHQQHYASNTSDVAKYQSLAMSLISATLFLYSYGFISSIMSLPDIRSDGGLLALHSLNQKSGLNIAVEDPLHVDVDADTDIDDAAEVEGEGEEVDDTEEKEEIGEEKDDFEEQFEKEVKQRKQSQAKTTHEKYGIPAATWPVTSTNKLQNKWITLPHPGDEAMTVIVPPFWSPPVHNNQLMPKEKALAIGSCITPDPSNPQNYQRGEECPLHERTVFVAIASYRDWQCKHTVTSIFQRAKHPERIRVAVVDQIVDGDDICDEPISETCATLPDQVICKYADQIDVYRMDAPLAVGPVFARHIGHRQYRGEYYTMQSDAHVTFTQDWDEDIISQQIATKDEMTVLTTYLTDIVGSIDEKTGKSLRNTRPIMCNTAYEGGPQGMHLRHLSQPERVPPKDLTMPQLSPWWAAGFSFSRGHFVVNVPYDLYQPMIFQGEEMSIGIRGFTIGYDYYAPMRSVCFHHYASMNKDRVKVPHFWENTNTYAG